VHALLHRTLPHRGISKCKCKYHFAPIWYEGVKFGRIASIGKLRAYWKHMHSGAMILICPFSSDQITEAHLSAGQDVYADLQGWHLFLKDMQGSQGLKMSQVRRMPQGAPPGSGGSRSLTWV